MYFHTYTQVYIWLIDILTYITIYIKRVVKPVIYTVDKKQSYSNIVFFHIYTFTLNYTYWLINIITYTDYIDKSIYNNSVVWVFNIPWQELGRFVSAVSEHLSPSLQIGWKAWPLLKLVAYMFLLLGYQDFWNDKKILASKSTWT